MVMCDICIERQNWLLEAGDGSQVVCTCCEDVPEEDDPSATDVGTQTSLKRAAVTIPGAPKRKVQNIYIFLKTKIHRPEMTSTNPSAYQLFSRCFMVELYWVVAPVVIQPVLEFVDIFRIYNILW